MCMILMLFYLLGGMQKGEKKVSEKYNNDDPGSNSDISIGNGILYIYIIFNNIVYEDSVILAGFLNIIIITFLYISWVHFMRKISEDVNKLNSENLTCSNYTLALKGLPRTFDEKDFTISAFGSDKVERSSFTFDISEIVHLKSSLAKLKSRHFIIEKIRTEYKNCAPNATESEITTATAANYPTSGCLCCKSINL